MCTSLIQNLCSKARCVFFNVVVRRVLNEEHLGVKNAKMFEPVDPDF